MKFILHGLRQGQKLWATVEEVLKTGELIVNFGGDLVRVANQTQRNLRHGQRIQVMVTAIKPLQFRLVEFKSQLMSLDIVA